MSDEIEAGAPETAGLTGKELRFVLAFCDLGAATCGSARLSAEKAGYKGGRSSPWRLLRRHAVREAIRQHHERLMDQTLISNAKILADLEHHRQVALGKTPPDVSAANRCTELMGKSIGMFDDVVRVNVEKQQEMSQAERLECDRLASLLLTGHEPGYVLDVLPKLTALPAAPSDQKGQ